MKSKLKFHKTKGMTILETVIYLAISAVIVFSTLVIMTSMIKKTNEENKSSYRLNKLYSTMNTIEKYTNAGQASFVRFENGMLCFTDKTDYKNCEINQQGPNLKFNIGDGHLYFFHNESYNTEVESFKCNIKDNLLYINLKLKTGEMMKKCIHINH